VFIPGVWKGRWAASPTGADFQAIVSALLELKGDAATLAWLQAMKTNSVAYRGNGTVLKAVNSGQIEGLYPASSTMPLLHLTPRSWSPSRCR
jgi:ABC-type Fe3+ transport system substrate-binding protein